MKTHRSSRNNRSFSLIRAITAIALWSPRAAMAFVASGDRIFTVSSPPRQLSHDRLVISKIAGERDAESTSARTTPGEGPIGGYEAYKSATRTYPANVIPPSMVQNAKKTFNKIATQTAASSSNTSTSNNHWQSYGPLQNSVQPGVLSFSGATTATASRDTALVIAPTCAPGNCRLWVGTAGGGVWRTDDALAATPTWTWLTGVLALNSVGALVADPNDSSGNTLYVGTGEGNRCSSGCESGVGIYKTTDGGNSWTKLPDACVSNTTYNCANSGDAFLGRGINQIVIDPTNKNHLFVGTAASSDSTAPNAAQFWRTDNSNQSAAALLASESAGSTEPPASTVGPQYYNGWQKLSSNMTASPYYATINFCTGQCWYDEDVYTPAGLPDTVYVIGSYLYGEQPCNTKGVGCGNGRSNGRAVLYSTTAGDPETITPIGSTVTTRTFTDLTYDMQNTPASWCAFGASGEALFGGVSAPFACLWAPNNIHPDQHAIVVNPSNPTQIFEGSDGGVIRTDGAFGDLSFRCNSNERPLLGAASLNNCKRLLSRVPNLITHTDRNLDTLQFINVAINPSNPAEVQGGTQDNGTWSSNDPVGDRNNWPQNIYGDGGNSGYDATNATYRFNEFTSGASDSNFENGDPTKWVITSAPLVNSGEAFSFYWPQIADPNPPAGAHPIFSGGNHVWRTWSFGAGTPGAVPQDKTPNVAFYEANCQEFTVSFNNPICGDYQPLGGPAGANTAGSLTGTFYGADRTGGSMSWLARNKTDHGTLWATTSAGRIFVTHNADASNPATVTWHRIDNATSPTRFPSSIYSDPANVNHAWITYSGYNATTPTVPGHVFEALEGGP